MAIISTDMGDYFGAQELSVNAIPLLNPDQESHLPSIRSNYNNLGITAYNLKNYSDAVSFYEQSLKYTSDSLERLILKNNVANAYREQKDYEKSIAIYQSILQGKLSRIEYARVLANYAYTKWLRNPNYNAATELLLTLDIREAEKDLWGQNSSLSHLADYYENSGTDSSLFYAKKMHIIASRINSPDDQLEALQKLIRFSPPEQTKLYFKHYLRLNDSLQAARNAAKNQFALVRYDAEKNKSDNLRLQQENTEREYQIGASILISVALSITFALWYKKRKQRLQHEAQNTIKEGQLKTSQKVHDVVANGLYRIIAETNYATEIDKENLLDKLDVLYEQSRDISYDMPIVIKNGFQREITALILSFKTLNIEIDVMGIKEDEWSTVSPSVKHEIKHIVQELMVNMKKHSGAGFVIVRFEKDKQSINIHYADDGIGLSESVKFGNGLTSTGNRIEGINGTITFDTAAEKGIRIKISFPVA